MPVLTIAIEGQGVRPQTTPIKDLVEFLSNFESSVLETARQLEIEMAEGEAALSLVSITEGSNRLSLSVVPALAAAVSMVTTAQSTENYDNLPPKAHQALYAVYQQTARRGWEISIQGGEELNLSNARISIDHPVSNPKTEYIKGTTTIFGRCIKVGGAEPKVDIRLPNRSRLLHVEVTEPIAKKLAKNLYENVAITGDVWWDPISWEIVRLKAQRVSNIQAGSVSEAFREMAEVIGHKWSGVDAKDFVENIRAEGRDE